MACAAPEPVSRPAPPKRWPVPVAQRVQPARRATGALGGATGAVRVAICGAGTLGAIGLAMGAVGAGDGAAAAGGAGFATVAGFTAGPGGGAGFAIGDG